MKFFFKRSPGERAFDFCLLPFAVSFFLAVIGGILEWALGTRDSDPDSAHLPRSLSLMLGLGLTVYWLWALRGVVRAWRDPQAHVLRYASSGLLLMLLLACISLLIPHHD